MAANRNNVAGSSDNDGSSFDDFLREEGIYVKAAGIAAARVHAWQQQEQMRKQGIIVPPDEWEDASPNPSS